MLISMIGALAADARFALALRQVGAGGHFRHHQPGAETFGQAAERRIGNARHRGQNHAVRHRNRANAQ
jgi:hypothetical protein